MRCKKHYEHEHIYMAHIHYEHAHIYIGFRLLGDGLMAPLVVSLSVCFAPPTPCIQHAVFELRALGRRALDLLVALG